MLEEEKGTVLETFEAAASMAAESTEEAASRTAAAAFSSLSAVLAVPLPLELFLSSSAALSSVWASGSRSACRAVFSLARCRVPAGSHSAS